MSAEMGLFFLNRQDFPRIYKPIYSNIFSSNGFPMLKKAMSVSVFGVLLLVSMIASAASAPSNGQKTSSDGGVALFECTFDGTQVQAPEWVCSGLSSEGAEGFVGVGDNKIQAVSNALHEIACGLLFRVDGQSISHDHSFGNNLNVRGSYDGVELNNEILFKKNGRFIRVKSQSKSSDDPLGEFDRVDAISMKNCELKDFYEFLPSVGIVLRDEAVGPNGSVYVLLQYPLSDN